MKKYMLFVALAAAALVSCKKEIVTVPSGPDAQEPAAQATETVSAVIDEPVSKSDYTISGGTASFGWTQGDAFYRLVRKIDTENEGYYTDYDHYTYSAASIDGARATFNGSAVGSAYEDSGYALYPAGKSNGANFTHLSGSTLYFNLGESLVYDAANPLKDIVPMVGTLADGEYSFKPVTGVIGINAKNIPADATSISISSTSGGFSGNSVKMTGDNDAKYRTNIGNLVGESSIGLRNTWFTAGTSKTFTFSGLDAAKTYAFYFPAPVGTYTDLTITLKAGDTVLGTVKANGISLSVTRAKIIDIAAVIDFSRSNYAKIALSGTSSAVSAYLESASPAVKSVRLAVATGEADALAAAAASSLEITSAGSANAVEVTAGLSASGLYYLGYVAYGASSNEIVSGTLPVYYISAADAADVAGTYKNAYYKSIYPESMTSNGDDTITFEISDDPSKGNIMLTHAFGFCWDVSRSTHSSLTTYDFSQFSDGSPVYGFYNPASSNPKLVFSNISDQIFYYDAGGYPHFICEYGNNVLRFGFDSNAYNGTTYDVICWGGYLMNCYTNTSSYDLYWQQFGANKI